MPATTSHELFKVRNQMTQGHDSKRIFKNDRNYVIILSINAGDHMA